MTDKNISILRKILFFVSIFVLIFGLCINNNFIDFDLFSRLYQGFSVITTGHVQYHDIISYAKTNIWHDPEWLSSTFFWLVTYKFDTLGLIWLKIILAFLMIVSIAFSISQRLENKNDAYFIPFYIALLMLFYYTTSILDGTVRCQVFTLIFLAFWLFLLKKARNSNIPFYIMPPFMLLWLNIHGGSLSGLGILLLWTIGEALNKREYKKYLITFIVTCFVYLINPWGFDFIIYTVKSAFWDRCWVSEWSSPFTSLFGAFHYKIFLVLSTFAYAVSEILKKTKPKDLDFSKLLVYLSVVYLSCRHSKHIMLYFVVASILTYEDYLFIFKTIFSKFKIKKIFSKYFMLALDIVFAITIFVFGYNVYQGYGIKYSYAKRIFNTYPIRAVEFLKQNNIKGKLFAVFSESAYIAYKLHPNVQIYMDGREEQVWDDDIFDIEMYFLKRMGSYSNLMLDIYPPDIVLLSRHDLSNDIFSNSKDWHLIYEDKLFNIYIKAELDTKNYKILNVSNKKLMDDLLKESYFMRR